MPLPVAISYVFASEPWCGGTMAKAIGDWHGSADVLVIAASEAGIAEAFVTLDALNNHWRQWSERMVASIEANHGPIGQWALQSVGGYQNGYFEIEFTAPSVFGEEIAIAVGTLGNGFEEIGLGG